MLIVHARKRKLGKGKVEQFCFKAAPERIQIMNQVMNPELLFHVMFDVVCHV